MPVRPKKGKCEDDLKRFSGSSPPVCTRCERSNNGNRFGCGTTRHDRQARLTDWRKDSPGARPVVGSAASSFLTLFVCVPKCCVLGSGRRNSCRLRSPVFGFNTPERPTFGIVIGSTQSHVPPAVISRWDGVKNRFEFWARGKGPQLGLHDRIRRVVVYLASLTTGGQARTRH